MIHDWGKNTSYTETNIFLFTKIFFKIRNFLFRLKNIVKNFLLKKVWMKKYSIFKKSLIKNPYYIYWNFSITWIFHFPFSVKLVDFSSFYQFERLVFLFHVQYGETYEHFCRWALHSMINNSTLDMETL